MTKLQEIYNLVGFNDPNILSVCKLLIEELEKYCSDIVISRTGDNEILIYRNIDHCYKNLIIDEDCDISLFIIDTKQRIPSQTEVFFYNKGFDIKNIAHKIL